MRDDATPLTLDGTRFRDDLGRQVLLRGVNLGGDCKVPAVPDGRTHLPSDFADHRTVSFIGRPFPLDEAEGHFRRLAHWGFNCLRLLTTWEAVEHAGPGIYDEAYLDYFAEICRRAGEHGFHVFIDFHQDVWSRMSGGDGAPGWTFEAVGLDFTNFDAAGAAHVMQHRYDPIIGGRQPSYPQMSWSANYQAPANAIMWTLFFGGRDLAPSLRIAGTDAQDYLQSHYLGAMRAVAERVAGIAAVIGFDSLNEPGEGWIGQGLETPVAVTRGMRWSPLDGLAAAAGFTRWIERVDIDQPAGRLEAVNRNRVSIWLPGRDDPFRQSGVWDIASDGQPVALKLDHFRIRDGASVSLLGDYMLPFFRRIATTIRAVRDDWLLFAEVSPFHRLHETGYPPGMPERTVSAPHWYDYRTLVTKRLDADQPVVLQDGEMGTLADRYAFELGALTSIGERLDGGAPTLIGECGFPFDMNGRESFRRYAAGERGALPWRQQTRGFEAMFDVIDALQISATIWTYAASNSNAVEIGDGWNQEDLSIFSPDQQDHPGSLDSGARAIDGFCRPYVRRVQGQLLSQSYDRAVGSFQAAIDVDPAIDGHSEIYLPERVFGRCPKVAGLEACTWGVADQLLSVRGEARGQIRLVVTREGADQATKTTVVSEVGEE